MGRIGQQGRGRTALGVLLAAGVAGAVGWIAGGRDNGRPPREPGRTPVVAAALEHRSLPVILTTHGTVAAIESVDIRAQVGTTIRKVHVREGQTVLQGTPMFSLDTRAEQAHLGRAVAQASKSRADLAHAERTLARQRDLFARQFVAQTALDTAQTQVDSLRAQVAADQAAVVAARVSVDFGEIVAPITGRTGAIAVYPGTLVQPGGPVLVTLTRTDPVDVVFTLPEQHLPALHAAQRRGPLTVQAVPRDGDVRPRTGILNFIDSSIDPATGTIRLKARFANADAALWPGLFVGIRLSPETVPDALTIPAQAVQTGPEQQFLYAIDEGKVSVLPVQVRLIQAGIAVVTGEAPALRAGTRVVVEGAQNLKPGSLVSEGGTRTTAVPPHGEASAH